MWGASVFQEEDVLSMLMSLLDKNMLRPVAQEKTQPVFFLLETIREYGLELLRQLDELERAYQVLARYYLQLLQKAEGFLKGPQQGVWLRSLDQERQNISTALAWLIQSKQSEQALIFCEVFGKFCGLRGYWSEEAHWLKATLDLSRTQPATVWRGRVLRRFGHLAYRMRDLPTARSSFEESIAIAREAEDLPGLAGALSGLAWVCYREQDLAPVADLLAQCVEVARASGDAWSLANALESRARFLHLQGNLLDASQLMDESLTLARSIEDSENLARLLNAAISIEIAHQHLEQAAEFARESVAIARELGNKPLIALALNGLAEVAVARKDFQSALELYQQRLQFARELNDIPTVALMKLRLSEMALKQAHLEQAEQLARESMALFQACNDRANMSLATQALKEITRARQSGNL
jgi:tetratricopeptide (TPR) repeat protein